LGAGTRGRLEKLAGRAVELEPDRGVRVLVHAPAARHALDDVEPEAAASRQVGGTLAHPSVRVIGVVDLDVEGSTAAFEPDEQLRARVSATMPDAVGHQLRHEQRDVVQNLIRDTSTESFANQPAGARRGIGPSGNVGVDGKRLHD